MAIKMSEYSKTKHTGLKVHKDTVTYLFDIRIEGKRYRKTWKANKVHSKADRLKKAYEALEQFRKETLHQTTIVADMDATVIDYWTKLKSIKGWKKELINNYEYYYNKHLTSLSKIKIKDVKPAHFTSLNVTLDSLATATRKKAYEILKPLFELAVEDEIITKSPIKKSHIPVRKQLEEKKIVTNAVEKYKNVYTQIHRRYGSDEKIDIGNNKTIQCSINPHHRALFLLGFYGRRLQEVLNLKWEDIDFDNNEYIVRGNNSKVNTDMRFTLPADVKDALNEFKDTTGNIFTIKHVKDHYPKLRILTGIEEFSFHWMRNLAVSALSAHGVDATHLSAMLGHTDTATVKQYLSLQREASSAHTLDISKRLLG